MSDAVHANRYDRNFKTLTAAEQQTLAESTVVVIGLGGLGGGVCENLSRIGVGHLVVIDGDVFESSNLNRQLFSREDLLGTSKALAAKDRIENINSLVRVTAMAEYVDETNLHDIIKNADVVMDCLDSIDMRFKLQAAAAKARVPIAAGAIAGVTGQVMTILPGDPGYSLIYGDDISTQSKGVETQTGNISYCALMVACFQSSECVKLLLNRGEILRHKLLIVELWSNSIDVVQLL